MYHRERRLDPYTQKKELSIPHSIKGNRTVVLLASVALFAVLLVGAGISFGGGSVTKTFPCWSLLAHTTWFDPNHPHGFRTISVSQLDQNFLTLQVCNGGKDRKEFTIHGNIEKEDTLVVDFSPVGGPSSLHGFCNRGTIEWTDGNIWRRGLRLSELVAAGIQLADVAAGAIKSAHATHSSATDSSSTTTTSSIDSAAPTTSHAGSSHLIRIKAKTDEGVDEPVTRADMVSNQFLVNGYRQRFPGISILSEEREPPLPDILMTEPQSPAPSTASMILPDTLEPPTKILEGLQALGEGDPVFLVDDILVTIDPLDATKEFTEELLQFVTTQQCIVVNGRPIIGILHQPFVNGGATVAIAPLPTHTSPSEASPSRAAMASPPRVFGGVMDTNRVQRPIDKSSGRISGGKEEIVALSRSHSGNAEDIVAKYLPGYEALRAGGAGYKTLLVAAGQAGSYLHVTKSKLWDVCAADAFMVS
jgi:3'-phosphoadenosine 5'-phosphosulfate (PAPS) 3'-phosphatase